MSPTGEWILAPEDTTDLTNAKEKTEEYISEPTEEEESTRAPTGN